MTNKYFDTENASDSWTNVSYAWSNVAVSTQNIPKGLDRDVSITFTKDASDTQQRQVTVTLDGMKYNNATFTVTIPANTKIFTVDGLKTTTEEGKVGFTLDNTAYMLASATSGDRVGNRFENADFVQGSVGLGTGNEVQYNFTVPTYYTDMEINVTLDGLVPADDETRLESPADGRSAIKSYVFKPDAAGTYTLKLKTANKDESTCSLTLEAEKYYYETVRSTIDQTAAKYAFQSLTTNPAGSVRYGTGRTVSITFVLDTKDNNIRNKEVYINLVGLKNNDGKTSFTHKVVNDNRTVTIDNLKTTSDDGILRVTVEAAEYLPITTTISQRTPGEFKNVKFNKTKVGSKVGAVVELSFNIDNNSYYAGMVVNLDLDGLEPVDGNYSYTVSKSGDHKINLRTTQAVEGECRAQLKAAGMTDSQVVSVQQIAATYALKMTNISGSNTIYDIQITYTHPSKLNKNATYTLTFYVKAGTNNASGKDISIYLKNKDNNGDQRYPKLSISTVPQTWTRVTATIETGNDNNSGNFDMIAFNIGSLGDNNSIYIDDISLTLNGSNVNLIENGNFEGSDISRWYYKTNGDTPKCSYELVPEGYEGQ